MAYFEVEVSDSAIMDAGWIHKYDIKYETKEQVADIFRQVMQDLDNYYFVNNLPRDQVFEDIMSLLEKSYGV